MTRITLDAATLARLNNLNEMLIVCDESGRALGYFQPAAKNGPVPRSPSTREQLEELRKQRTGRPLKDIMRDLEQL